MKRAILLFIIAIFFNGCSGGNGNKKHLIIGIDDSYPPFSFIRGASVSGFDVDLIEAVAEKMNYQPKFITMKFNEIEKNLENGKIDIGAGGFSLSEKRKNEFLFSDPYYEPNFCIIYKKNKFGNDVYKLEDLKQDSKIGVQKGTVMVDFLENFLKERERINFQIIQFDNNSDMNDAMRKNEINYFITEDLQAEISIQNNQDLNFFIINSNNTKTIESYAFAFNKKNKKLAKFFNTELRNLEESGKIDILKMRWFSGLGIYDNIEAKNK